MQAAGTDAVSLERIFTSRYHVEVRSYVTGDRDNRQGIYQYITREREVGVLLLLFLSLFLLYRLYTDSENQFFLEVAKALLQLIVVVLLGGGVSLLVNYYNQQRAEREKERDNARKKEENRDEFRRKLLERLNQAYFDTKRVRRLLRAKAFSPPYYRTDVADPKVLLEPYDEHLLALNDTELDLEILERDIKASPSVFSDEMHIATAVWHMADCLREVVTEYEVYRGSFSGEPPSKELSELPKLMDFVRSRNESPSFGPFVKQYNDAKDAIQNDLLDYASSSPEDTISFAE